MEPRKPFACPRARTASGARGAGQARVALRARLASHTGFARLLVVALAMVGGGASGGCASALLQEGSPPPASHAEGWTKVSTLALVAQKDRADCGAAALAMVLRRWDAELDESAVRAAIGPIDDQAGLAAGRLREVARERGLQAFLIKGGFEDLAYELDRGRPVLVGVYRPVGGQAYPHYVVVAGINRRDKEVLAADPAEGWRRYGYREFAARWHLAHNLALVVWR